MTGTKFVVVVVLAVFISSPRVSHAIYDWEKVKPIACGGDWDPKPACACYDIDGEKPVLVCNKIGDTKQLVDVFATLGKKVQFDEFRLMNSTVASLPSGVFGLASFFTFIFDQAGLETIESGAFKGSEQTGVGVTLSNNNLKDFKFEILAQLANLRALVMMDEAGVKEVEDNAFAKFPNLGYVNFEVSSIRRIGKGAFANLHAVMSIVIANNAVPMEEVAENAFANPTAAKFATLSLRNNSMAASALSADSFSGVSAPYIDLSLNPLETLPEGVFDKVLQSLAKLSNGVLVGNRTTIKCDQSLKWLVSKPAEIKKPLQLFKCPDGKLLTEIKESDLAA